MTDSPSDERLLLAEDVVEICRDGPSVEAACRITFSLRTTPSIWIETKLNPAMQVGTVARLTLKDSRVTFDGF